jgi:hypothetical protein
MSESLMLAVIQVVKVLEKPSLRVMCLMVDSMAMVCWGDVEEECVVFRIDSIEIVQVGKCGIAVLEVEAAKSAFYVGRWETNARCGELKVKADIHTPSTIDISD